MKKKILSFLTMMCMAVALLPANVTVFAATSGACGDNLTWVLDDSGTLTISGTGKMTDWIYSNSMPWYSSKSNIKSVVIKNGVTSIGMGAFSEYDQLTSVTIPDSVTAIGVAAFWKCGKLSSVNVGDGLAVIYDRAFYNCNNLKKVNITDIASWCNIDFCSDNSNPLFYAKKLYLDDELITDLVIPGNVTSIGKHAFRSCSIESVSICDGVETIGDMAFAACLSLTNVTIPDSVISIGDMAFNYCSKLTNVAVSKNNPKYSSDSYGVLYDKNKTNLILYPIGSIRTEFIIPNSIISIGEYAFQCCDQLTSVTIPNSVTSIGVAAFQSCRKLSSVNIGNRITSIGDAAFASCSNLSKVNITDITSWCNIDFCSDDSNPLLYAEKLYLNGELITDLVIPEGVTSIGDYAFYNCSTLEKISWNAKNVTDLSSENYVFFNVGKNSNGIEVVFGENVETIPANAFHSCYDTRFLPNIVSVTISNSVKNIKNSAFWSCSNLKKVYYNGIEKEWNNITIGSYNTSLASATRTYFAYINIFDKDGNKVVDTTQNMGETVDTNNITVPDGCVLKLYKNEEMTDEYLLDTPISENMNLYYDIIGENKLKITGAESADIGQKGITESVTFATDKTAKYFVANIKYSSDLILSEIKSEVFDIEKDEYTEGGQKYLSLTCTNKTGGNIPVNTAINTFDLTFDISENAKANDILSVEFVTDETLLADDNGNNYSFDGLGKAEIKVNPILVNTITINGADEIDKATQYTAVILPENATNNEVEWTVDNSEIATISTDGTLTPIKAGTVKIKATAKDESDIYGEKSVNVEVYAQITLLSANVGSWDKEFTPTEREYTIYVPKDTSSIKLTATHSGTFKYGNNTFYSGRAKQVSLTGDETILTLSYSQTGYTNSEYKIKIVKFEGTKTNVSDDGTTFTVKPINIANGNTVILALYNGNMFVGMEVPQKYEGNDLTFKTNKTYTNAKIMVWNSLDGMKPVCEAEILNIKID